MDGNIFQRRLRSRKLAIFALTAAIAAPASGPALADTGIASAEFDAHFSQYERPAAKFQAAPGAVDITAIEVPVEPEPAVSSLGTGVASYYGRKFDGRRTASGETFRMTELTAAHRTLPFGSKVRVTNPSNGREVIVRINDRGPFHGNRLIDLSRAAAERIGLIQRGSGTVELALLD